VRSCLAIAGAIGVRVETDGDRDRRKAISTGSLMTKSDEEFIDLMARVRLDDNQALAQLITLYEPTVRRAAHVLLGKALRSSLDPTDLVQSVHLQLIVGLRRDKLSIGSPEQLRSLAVTLLRHKFIEHWRHHRCRVRHHMALAATGAPERDGRSTTALRAVDPARAAEFQDVLDHLCGQLRADDHRLVVMRLHGYRTGEIAAELGIEPAVLRMRLCRLRKRLRSEKPMTEWA
jgi:RNA polymerase sigma factor (sigma-70 family)